ncbi:hypothetical protein AB0C34_20320 [Nocardia sp. NPDC049220]|uniref:hypothetical protein n=1 Tax=Nocardia sp. NPDC049220 TaxID=3155273 RepID=UPI0034037E04
MPLKYNVVDEMPGFAVSPRDQQALMKIVSWDRTPSFAVPGRTAWYVLSEPVIDPMTSRTLVAAKIKGVGAWHPESAAPPSHSDAVEPGAPTPPSNRAYAETTRNPHFGVDANGCFASIFSEPAPYGGITLPRAQREFDNAATLYRAGAPSIVPLAVLRYDDGRLFDEHPLGVVISLAWDESPYSLDLLRVENPAATAEERAHAVSVREALGYSPHRCDGAADLSVRALVGRQIGMRLRELAQAQLYRYSAGWDNFYLDRRSSTVYLTDLDSTRELQELPSHVQGMQVLRDLAGGIYQIVNKIYHPSAIDDYDLQTLLDIDPMAAVLEGYFGIDKLHAMRLTQPLWAYFVPHWFLLKRHRGQIQGWSMESKAQRKSYKMEMNVFYALAILVLAETYRTFRERLHLPPCPSDADLRQRMSQLLGDRVDLLEFLAAPTVEVVPPD